MEKKIGHLEAGLKQTQKWWWHSLVPARGEWEASGTGECSDGLAGDIPGMRVAGEGPDTWGDPGQFPARPLGDTIVYGELGSRVPVKKWTDGFQNLYFNNWKVLDSAEMLDTLQGDDFIFPFHYLKYDALFTRCTWMSVLCSLNTF